MCGSPLPLTQICTTFDTPNLNLRRFFSRALPSGQKHMCCGKPPFAASAKCAVSLCHPATMTESREFAAIANLMCIFWKRTSYRQPHRSWKLTRWSLSGSRIRRLRDSYAKFVCQTCMSSRTAFMQSKISLKILELYWNFSGLNSIHLSSSGFPSQGNERWIPYNGGCKTYWLPAGRFLCMRTSPCTTLFLRVFVFRIFVNNNSVDFRQSGSNWNTTATWSPRSLKRPSITFCEAKIAFQLAKFTVPPLALARICEKIPFKASSTILQWVHMLPTKRKISFVFASPRSAFAGRPLLSNHLGYGMATPLVRLGNSSTDWNAGGANSEYDGRCWSELFAAISRAMH